MKHKFFKLLPDLLLTLNLGIGFMLSPIYGLFTVVVWVFIALDTKQRYIKNKSAHDDAETIIIEEPETWEQRQN